MVKLIINVKSYRFNLIYRDVERANTSKSKYQLVSSRHKDPRDTGGALLHRDSYADIESSWLAL